MTNDVRHAHALLSQEPELAVPVPARGCQHAALAGRDQLAGVKREAGDVAVRLADPLPAAFQEQLAANGAGRVFDQRQVVPAGYREHTWQVARHSKLVDA